MDDLERKLHSTNPTTVVWVYSRVVEIINQKNAEDVENCHQLEFLKEKCLTDDPMISDVAGRSLFQLVELGTLSASTILAEFIAKIKLVKCHFSLVNLVGNLLLFENKSTKKLGKIPNTYNLCSPQHPYVTILLENTKASVSIINRIKYFYNNKETLGYLHDLFEPVYLFSLCHPQQSPSLNLFGRKIWNFLMETCEIQPSIAYNILTWLPLHNRNCSELVSDYLEEALQYSFSNGLNTEIIILLHVSHLCTMAQMKLDIYQELLILQEVLEASDELVTGNCVLLMFVKLFDLVSPVYLPQVLIICKCLISKTNIHRFVAASLQAALLPWIVNECSYLEESIESMYQIISYFDSNRFCVKKNERLESFTHKFWSLLSSNREIFLNARICLMIECEGERELLKWLQDVDTLPDHFTEDIYHFLCGLLTLKQLEPAVYKKILRITVDYATKNAPLSQKLAMIIISKTASETDPEIRLELLQALPKMVVYRDNIGRIMGFLQTISKGSPELFTFGLSLMYEAWKIDNRCYSYLEDMLVVDCFSTRRWEFYVTKAYIIKELCKRKPHLYGKDMVAHLSKILNDCSDVDGALPTAIALDGIKILYKSEVVDIVSTWKTLAPKFDGDTRLPVIEGLCSLMEEIAELPYVETYIELNREVIEKLWNYVELGDPDISEAAFNTLSKFRLEDICSKLPERYIEEVEQQNTPTTTYLLPGKIWIKFLIENGASKLAVDFVRKLIKSEIDAYLKYVYQVKGSKEPLNYGYLPTHSVLRGIGEFVRTWVIKWKGSIHDILYVECLRIISREYSKPLPPLDWCFLQELLHEPRCRSFCIDIAAHQVILSGTARRLIENLIVAITENPQEPDILSLYRNMKHLAKSIQPMILKPFIESSFAFAINEFGTGSRNLLKNLVEMSAEVLKDGNVQETNKITIADVICQEISVSETKSELFRLLLECAVLLPNKNLEAIANFKAIEAKEWYDKVVEVRCSVALNTKTSPLQWLNDIIENISMNGRNIVYLSKMISVFRSHINNAEECAMWLYELICEIQTKVANRSAMEEICIYLDILIVMVIEFSGYSIFMPEYDEAQAIKLFPSSFACLMQSDIWSVCTNQALEWFFHMNTLTTIASKYKNLFAMSLKCLRHDDEFRKSDKWMKYLGCVQDMDY